MIRKLMLLSFFFFAVPLLHGESEVRMRHLEQRVSKLEEKPTGSHQYDPITPNAGPKVCDGMDMFLSVDFIYWSARLDTLSYAKTGVGGGSSSVSRGTVYTVDWKFDPGFKAGFGWTFDHGGWDLFLQYTWFYTNLHDKTHSSNLTVGFTEFGNIGSIDRAHAHWDLHYQTGDFELGRNYYVNRFLKLRPFIGFKGTWQKQAFNSFFTSGVGSDDPENLISRQEQRLWGIGMRMGLHTSWQFYKWWGLYGNLALTGIWLDYDADRLDLQKEPGMPDLKLAHIDVSLHQVKPVLELAIGLRLETYFNCNRLHVMLQAGWETQIWINQTLLINLIDYYDRFDLNMHGLTAKFRLDF